MGVLDERRPFRNESSEQAVQPLGYAQRLMRLAGLAPRPQIEQLEKRELLSTITITAASNIDPVSGLGIVQVPFAYFLPYLGTDFELQPDQGTPQRTTEAFSQIPFGPIGSGQGAVFPNTSIVPVHNVNPPADFRVAGVPENADNQNRWARTVLNQTGEFVQFEFRARQNPAIRTAVQSFSATFRADRTNPTDVSGLDVARARVSVLFRDQILATIQGPALAALFAGGTGPGTGTLSFGLGQLPAGVSAFDAVRIEQLAPFGLPDDPAFELDDISYTQNRPRFTQLLESKIVGAMATLVGPIGATASFFDLYDRPLALTIELGRVEGSELLLGDLNDDGVPDVLNDGTASDGLGRIVLRGVDSRSSFSLWPGVIEATTTPDANASFFTGAFAMTLVDSRAGRFSALEQAEFGYALDFNDGQLRVSGLPPAGGGVVLGSPWIRNRTLSPLQTIAFLADPAAQSGLIDFNRSNQGIFVGSDDRPESIGKISINGVVHGSSRFTGSVERFDVGYMVGSATFRGDVGSMNVSTDAGMWVPDPGFAITNPNVRLEPVFRTFSQFVFERTVGDLAIGGRTVADVTVLGDVNNPGTRPARDFAVYDEREIVIPRDTDVQELDLVRSALGNNGIGAAPSLTPYLRPESELLFRGGAGSGVTGLPVVMGTDWLRNDSLMSAEFVGGFTGGVRVRGELSGANSVLEEDDADVFAFVVDGTSEVVIEATSEGRLFGPYFRIMDADGRTLAAPEQPREFRGLNPRVTQTQNRFASTRASFRPTNPGVYYVAMTDEFGADDGFTVYRYSLAISGLAPVSFGSYRVAAGSGLSLAGGGTFGSGISNSVTVLSGNMGAVRVGVGNGGPDGDDASPTGAFNTNLPSVDDSVSFQGGIFAIAGDLHAIIAGGDIGAPRPSGIATVVDFTIGTGARGGNLGSLITGVHPGWGTGPRLNRGTVTPSEGDVNDLILRVRGRVGMLDIRGGIGMDQDNTDGDPRAPTGRGMNLFTGGSGPNTAGTFPGDIGMIRVGFHVHGAIQGGHTNSIRTSPGSTIGAILVSQDAYTDGSGRSGIYDGNQGWPITTGAGSDVRFFDMPTIDLINGDDVTIAIRGDQQLIIPDDQGARVSIAVVGAAPGEVVGRVRRVPIDGSQGAAIAQIEIDNLVGRTLAISGVAGSSRDVISLGRIVIAQSDASSIVQLSGGSQIDVYRIESPNPLLRIENSTTRGDIINADVGGVQFVEVAGDLGRTETVAFGPDSYAPWLGLTGDGPSQTVGGPVGFVAVNDAAERITIDDDFNGEVYRPINNPARQGGDAFLDDLGSPLGDRHTGLIVRNGSVQSVLVGGVLNGLVLQGNEAGAGLLADVVVNSDRTTAPGGFDGVIAPIYARDLTQIDVGDGIQRANRNNPMGPAGLFVTNNIGTVRGQGQGRPLQINGVINAANNVAEVPPEGTADGITTLDFAGARVSDSYIGVGKFDDFWDSFYYGEELVALGDIEALTLGSGTLFRSRVFGLNMSRVTGQGGTFDASSIAALGNIDTISFTNFRNTTRTGDELDFQRSEVISGGDINTISAAVDMEDLFVDTIGDIRNSISARDIVRSTFEVDGEAQAFTTIRDIRGSSFNAGRIAGFQVGGSLVSSSISVSAPLGPVQAGDRIQTTSIEVTGPAGSISTITALNGINGSFTVSGPIGSITSTRGSIDARLVTTGDAGNVTTLTAFGDLVLTGDISGRLGTATTGGNFGRLGQTGYFLARAGVQSLTVAGSLYNELRSGQDVGTVTLGGAPNKPGNDRTGRGSIIASGRIGSVTVTNGDLGGSIESFSGGVQSVTITNGSLLPGARIAAFSGNVESVTITNGSLLGNVLADLDIRNLSITASPTQGFGDVGISSLRSQFAVVDARRNQLPAGVAAAPGFDGPLVKAGRDIVNVTVGGNVWESGFYAGRTIQNISVAGFVANNADIGSKGSFFAAGDRIATLRAGSLGDAQVIAGLVDMGADNRPGGTGINADTVRAGSIGTVAAAGGSFGTTFAAGIDPGADGIYGNDPRIAGNTGGADDRLALGVSRVDALTLGVAGPNFGAAVANSQLLASRSGQSASVAGDSRFGTGSNLRVEPTNIAGDQLDSGAGTPGTAFSGTRTFTVGGTSYTLNFSGPGQAFFQVLSTGTGVGNADALLTLRNTTSASSLILSSANGRLENLTIRTNNDASLGTLRFDSRLAGNSLVLVDGGVGTLAGTSTGALTLGSAVFQPQVRIGGDVSSITFSGAANDAAFSARAIGSATFAAGFGRTDVNRSFELRGLSLSNLNVTGNVSGGLVRVERDIASVTITGSASGLRLGTGGSIQTLNITGAASRLVVAAGYDLAQVQIGGEAFDSSFSAGADLGQDVAFDGTGRNADTVRAGNINTATIAGNFRESDLTAGYLRGADSFFATSDDRIAGGRSSIGGLTIGGTVVGSNRQSESYSVASSGTIGLVTVGGGQIPTVLGNFKREARNLAPVPIEVRDVVVGTDAGVVSANVIFNQPMNSAGISRALTVAEVRGQGDVEIRLVEGTDYTLSYNDADSTLTVTFSRSVTGQDVPVVPGRPGPGVYRFRFDDATTEARLSNVRVVTTGDLTASAVVGDAGDKATEQRIALANGGFANLYAPVDLNVVLDSGGIPDGLPDVNREFTIRGVLGDHPDNDATFFRFSGDVDLYNITLQAGQILRLGALDGAAQRAPFALFTSTGTAVTRFGDTALSLAAPVPTGDLNDFSFPQVYFIRQTGVYTIAVGNSGNAFNDALNNPPPEPGQLGEYSFTVEVFDDGDTGFSSATPAGDGQTLARPPVAIDFAGFDGALGTSDDVSQLIVGDYTFRLLAGTDNALGTADDVVRGDNAAGGVIERIGTRVTAGVDSAIGPVGSRGSPNVVFADADVYHLNGRTTITPGERYRVTLRLAQTGSDLGSLSSLGVQDVRGAVQLGLFDTSTSDSINDADLVFSPTDFLPNAGTPNTTLASSTNATYGYDSRGDFFIEFLMPAALGTTSTPGTFAIMVQGVVNSDYRLEVVASGEVGTREQRRQNIFIETNGGSIDWYQAGGLPTTLSAFTAQAIGLNGGLANGQNVNDFVLAQLVDNLNSIYQDADLDVVFSTNPADFEFQPYSTIFLSSSVDPVNPLFRSFSGNNFDFFSFDANNPTAGFVPTQPYGATQRVDALNASLEDEGVVFVPSFGLLGYGPSQQDVNRFVGSLTAAVARRAGEMMGARVTEDNARTGVSAAGLDPFAADSVNIGDADLPYALTDFSRQLSTGFDTVINTNFFLGRQRAISLLGAAIRPRV